MAYEKQETIVPLRSDITNSTITMTDITWLTMTLWVGWYRVTFVPFYNVNATTTGTWWNFGSWTAVITICSCKIITYALSS